MDVVSTAINAAVVAAIGFVLAWLGKGQFEAIHHRFEEVDRRFEAVDRRFEAVDRRFGGLEEQLDRRIGGLGDRIDRRMEVMQASLDAMRSDLTQVALAVGVQPRATNA